METFLITLAVVAYLHLYCKHLGLRWKIKELDRAIKDLHKAMNPPDDDDEFDEAEFMDEGDYSKYHDDDDET